MSMTKYIFVYELKHINTVQRKTRTSELWTANFRLTIASKMQIEGKGYNVLKYAL